MTACDSETLLIDGAAAFQRAATAAGVWEKQYSIGRQRLRVRYAGEAVLTALHPALAHREASSTAGPTDLSIDVFTSVAPPVRLPREQWTRASVSWQDHGFERSNSYVHYSGGRCQRLTVMSRSAGRGFVCYTDPERIPAWDRATPLRELLSAWLQPLGGQLVHGAAIGDERTAILLAGAGGAGKSNTALACLQDPGLRYLGDDLCLLTRSASGYAVHCLYSSAKLCPHDLSRYAHLSLPVSAQAPDGVEKPSLYLWPACAARIAAERPLSAIVLPCITAAAHPRIVPAGRADAWRALVHSTLLVVSSNTRATHAWLAEVVRNLPIYRLELSPERSGIPGVIHEFLRGRDRRAA